MPESYCWGWNAGIGWKEVEGAGKEEVAGLGGWKKDWFWGAGKELVGWKKLVDCWGWKKLVDCCGWKKLVDWVWVLPDCGKKVKPEVISGTI